MPMRIPAKLTDSDLADAHDAADLVASEKYRPYLPGRMLAMLVARFRHDAAEALGVELPPLRRRPAASARRLDELTSAELGALSDAVDALVDRFTPCMDDPALPQLLGSLREELIAERARIADELIAKAKAS
jgi:hypothetical protein